MTFASMMERRVNELLVGLASCLCSELRSAAAECGGVAPCFCSVLPGNAVAFDYCDEGRCDENNGMAWSRLVGITNLSDPVNPTCVTTYQITVEVGVLRSAPLFDESGEPPGAEEQLASSLQQVFDMGVLHKVLTCCSLGDEPDDAFGDRVLGEYVPLGPEGGCVGGVWNATWTLDLS